MNNTRDAQTYRCSHCDYSLSFAAGTYTRHVAVTMLRAEGWMLEIGEARCPKHAPARISAPSLLERQLRASVAMVAARKAGRGSVVGSDQRFAGCSPRTATVVPATQRTPVLRMVHSDGDHEREAAGGSMAALAQRWGGGR